jgi:hypothetical protein
VDASFFDMHRSTTQLLPMQISVSEMALPQSYVERNFVKHGWKTATVVLSCVCSIFLIALVILLAVVIADAVRVKRAFHYAATNNNACVKEVCTVYPDDNIGIPPPAPPGKFSLHFARFSADLVIRLSDYVNRKTSALTPPQGITAIGTMSTPQGKNAAWVVKTADNSQVWLVFRGTATRKEWEQDFQMQQAPFTVRMASRKTSELAFPDMAARGMRSSEGLFGPEVMVHSGFLNIYEGMRAQVIALAASLPASTTFNIVGHSLGASQALLATLDVATQFPERNLSTYVYAPPRVGNNAFAKAISTASNILSLFLIVNTSDVVPDVPLAVQPNIPKPTQPWTYTHGGTILTFTDNWGSWMHCHTMPVYIKNLDKLQLPL